MIIRAGSSGKMPPTSATVLRFDETNTSEAILPPNAKVDNPNV